MHAFARRFTDKVLLIQHVDGVAEGGAHLRGIERRIQAAARHAACRR